MNGHRKKHSKCKSKILFEKYGVENCMIELVEEYPCENVEQLNRREGEIMRANKCVNRRIEGRTKDKIKEYQKEYREKNKEYQKDYQKIYREANK
jgi:adenylate kinase family enzyme